MRPILPTLQLLATPMQGNIRSTPAGEVRQLRGRFSGARVPRGRRCMQKYSLFDSAQPGFNIEDWTVWSKTAPMETIGRVTEGEFRALVRKVACIARV